MDAPDRVGVVRCRGLRPAGGGFGGTSPADRSEATRATEMRTAVRRVELR